MGGQRTLLPSGGFREYLYHQVGETITANGISGKVIERIGGRPGHDGLPQYSNTSKVYFKMDENGRIEQARIYDGRRCVLDIDWGHNHHEFKKGIAHVHEYISGKGSNLHRDEKYVRYLSDDEKREYGGLLLKADPGIILL